MPPKLDLGLAIKVVKPFDGTATNLQNWKESVELLQDYAEGVAEATLLKFLKTTLVGAAHGAIDNVATIDEAFNTLGGKFTIRVTPRAVEKEMQTKKQNAKSITDFGTEIEKLTAKLAAAHVSMGTFANEAAAANIVQPIAVQAFIEGLKDPQTAFFVRARNPTLLNRAISDALEVTPTSSSNTENVLFFHQGGYKNRGSNNNRYYQNHYRGRGRGYGNYRDRGNGNFRGHNGNYRGQNNNNHNRSNYHNNQNNGGNNAGNHSHNNRGRGSYRGRNEANLAEGMNVTANQPTQQQNQQQQEHESNLIDLFR